MLHNLKIEWLKIKGYKVFQIFSILYIFGIIAIIFIFYRVYNDFVKKIADDMQMGAAVKDDMFDIFKGDTIWQTTCFWTSFLLYLPGIIVIMLFTNEVNFKTHRQNIIDGWKRSEFITSKISLIVCITLVVTITNILAVFIMCKFVNISFTMDWQTLGYCFLQTFTYLMFALTMAILLRKSGVAIILFFVYGLIIEAILVGTLNSQGLSPSGYFLPLQAADTLIPFSKIYSNVPNQYYLLTAALAWCSIYIFSAIRKYQTEDL